MKKRLIIFMPSVEGGGVEKNFFIISNYLANKLGKVFLITAENNFSKKFKNIEIISPRSNFWRNKGRFRKYIICVLLLIKMLLKNHDSLVLSFQANLYSILICKLFKTRVICRSNSSPSGWSKNSIKIHIFKVGLSLADAIIVNSIEFKSEMKKKFSINPIHIYNPLNKLEVIKLSKKKLNTKIFKSNKNLNILNVGRLVNQKDQITLVKAINLIKGKIPLEVIIMGRGILKKKLENYIENNNLKSIIKIIDFKDNPFNYIKKSELFILTSAFEGLPNVLLEAQTLKKFIISSSCPTGPREILLNGKAGFLFKINNAYQLSKKILEYYKNKKKLNKMINLGFKKLERFDEEKNLEKYFNLINKYL